MCDPDRLLRYRVTASKSNDATHLRARNGTYTKFHFAQLASVEFKRPSHSSVQTVPILSHMKLSTIDFNVFILEILTNWGGKRTGLKRLQIHGSPVSAVSN